MEDQIIQAVEELATIPYFPSESAARETVMRHLFRIVDDPQKLRWLVDTAVAHMREWRGIAELRALYCTRFRPADGVEANECGMPGFTPADNELEYIAAQGRKQVAMIEQWKREAALLPEKERKENRLLLEAAEHAR